MRPDEDDEAQVAGRVLSSLRAMLPEPDVGYRIQGIAAHILLHLGARVLEVNSQGHPDILAADAEGSIRLEVEADLGAERARLLSVEDLEAIRPVEKGDRGYFALAECGAFPRWKLVPHQGLELRNVEALPAVLGALSDGPLSLAWTREFRSLLVRNSSNLPTLTYDRLRTRALEGRPV